MTSFASALTAADIERIISREFPSAKLEVKGILESYGKQPWEHEPHRVRAAVLYLAKGKIEDVRSLVRAACSDYRDVLMWAEYPSYDEGERARDTDVERYRAWLEMKYS